MNKTKIDKKILEQFKERGSFSRSELYDFYRRYDPELNPQTFGWRLYDLKKKNLIQEVRQGIYKVSLQKKYKPQIDERMKEIYKLVSEAYQQVKIVIWSTSWINSFSLHQTFHSYIVLETASDVVESLFFKMKDMQIPNVFLKPDTSLLNRYAAGEQEPIIIKNLITKSPTKKIEHINIPSLEKILVDLFADEKIFYMYQGHELKEIYRSAIRQYTINYTKLFHYARRRGKEAEMQSYLTTNFQYELEGILND